MNIALPWESYFDGWDSSTLLSIENFFYRRILGKDHTDLAVHIRMEKSDLYHWTIIIDIEDDEYSCYDGEEASKEAAMIAADACLIQLGWKLTDDKFAVLE
jgi:hypothetical protein